MSKESHFIFSYVKYQERNYNLYKYQIRVSNNNWIKVE